jgi:hypothetical protein
MNLYKGGCVSVDLLSKCGSNFASNTHHFNRALNLAGDFGWEPAGVKLRGHPDFDQWDYLSSNGQEISAKDALGISSALKIALDDIPNEDQQNGRPDDELNSIEYFSGPQFKEWLRQFAAFCAAGSFKVY